MFGASQGAYAEKAAAKWRFLTPLPDNMTFEQGAGEPTVAFYLEVV